MVTRRAFIYYFLLFLWAIKLSAQIPANYYLLAENKTGAELKTALYNIIKGHNSLGYSNVWSAFNTTDKRSDGKVWDIYSTCNFTFVTDQDKGSGGTAECQFYNREHTVPQSLFSQNEPMRSDIFHVYPTDKKVNAVRADYPYGEVGTATYTASNGGRLGNNTFPGYTGTVFEPANEFKGDLARTYFYMVTRYENVVSNWLTFANFQKNTYPSLSPWTKDMLLKWHRNDPVSQKEIDRNNAVYAIQNNRNPFIDHPEYVEMIWGTFTGVTTVPSVVTTPSAVNYPPTVSGVTFTGMHMQTLTGNLMPYVLYNGTVNVAFLVLNEVETENGGTVYVTSLGGVTYIPPASNINQDSFTFTVCAGSECASATVEIILFAVTNPVFWVYADNATITGVYNRSASGNISNYYRNLNNQPITVSAFNGTLSTGGRLLLKNNGDYTYIPSVNFLGIENYLYTVCSGMECATASLTFVVASPTQTFDNDYQNIHLHPNPVDSYLEVYNHTDANQTAIIRNQFGIKIHEFVLCSGKNILNTNNLNLSSGIYFMVVNNRFYRFMKR